MDIIERIKQMILKRTKVNKLSENPNSERFNFIGNAENIRIENIKANKVWFVGDCDELDNYYLNQDVSGFAKNPIYNTNKKQYFHALSRKECNIKKIHTGIPRASVITLVNVIGSPKIECDEQDKWNAIAEDNDFDNLLTQQIRPLTLVEGYGAVKPLFNKSVCKNPLISYYEALDCDYIVKSGIIVGVIYKDYYEFQGKNYVLLETRYREDGNSIIKYELFRYSKSNDAVKVPLSTIPEIGESLNEEGYCIPGIDCILGQPVKYFHDPLNKNYGLSVFAGKLDIADDMDMIASIESNTEKNSSPVTYYPVDLLKRDSKNGRPIMPQLFNREFIKKPTVPNGQGVEDSKIDVDSPNLDFSHYSAALLEKSKLFFNGYLSPTTMGVDIARRDNGEAQREKEKVTIMTRNNIIASETIFLKKIVNSSLMLKEYMDTGKITKTDYHVNVKYNEFANPSMETVIPILGNAWSQGQISTERYVKAMYPDDDEVNIQKEIQWLDNNREKDNLGLEDLMNEDRSEGQNPAATESENEDSNLNIPGAPESRFDKENTSRVAEGK